jgi:hypothetical protein
MLIIEMDKFIKNVPLACLIIFVPVIWLTNDVHYSNIFIAAFCGLVIFTLTAGVYIIMARKGKAIIEAKNYIYVMLGAGLLTFIVLYAGLEYFYA